MEKTENLNEETKKVSKPIAISSLSYGAVLGLYIYLANDNISVLTAIIISFVLGFLFFALAAYSKTILTLP